MSREPDLINAALGVRIWKILPPDEAAYAANPDWRAGLEAFLIEADRGVFSPIFTRWYGGLIALRAFPGVKPAVLHFEGAEYELEWFAVAPDAPSPLIDIYDARSAGEETERVELTLPAEVVYQWAGTTDAQARDLLDAFLRAVASGESPDSPVHLGPYEVALWRAAWHDRLAGTVSHYTTGHWPTVPQGRA